MMNYHDFYVDHPDEFKEALANLDWGKITGLMDDIHPVKDFVEVEIVDHIIDEFSGFKEELTPPPNPDDEYNPEDDRSNTFPF